MLVGSSHVRKNAAAAISSPSRRGGVESLRTGGGGGYRFGGILLLGGGGQYPITCHEPEKCFVKKKIFFLLYRNVSFRGIITAMCETKYCDILKNI